MLLPFLTTLLSIPISPHPVAAPAVVVAAELMLLLLLLLLSRCSCLATDFSTPGGPRVCCLSAPQHKNGAYHQRRKYESSVHHKEEIQ